MTTEENTPPDRPVLDDTIPVIIKESESTTVRKLKRQLAAKEKPTIIQKKTTGGSDEEKLLKNAENAITQYDTARKVPMTAEVLESVINHLSVDNLGKVIADNIKEGKPADRARFAQHVIRMTFKNEDDNPVVTEDEIMRMADEQIYAVLKKDFGLPYNGN